MERRIERAVTGPGAGPGVGGRRREWRTTLERDDDDDVRAGGGAGRRAPCASLASLPSLSSSTSFFVSVRLNLFFCFQAP